MAKYIDGAWISVNEPIDLPVDGKDPNKNADNAKKNEFNRIINEWSQSLVKKANNSKSGKYLKFRGDIEQINADALAQLENGDFTLSNGKKLLTRPLIQEIKKGSTDQFKTFYTETRVSPWNPEQQGLKPPVGDFDAKYYLDTYGEDLKIKYDEAVANDDVDVLARYGSIEDYAYNDYSVTGKQAGNRGNAAQETSKADNVSETFDDLTDAEKAFIRDKQLGLVAKDKDGNLTSDFSNPNSSTAISQTLEAGFFGQEREDLQRFRSLATTTLKDTINKIKEQKAKEAELDLFKGLPGFGEILNINETLANSFLGDGAFGPVFSQAGINIERTADNLEQQFAGVTGINLNSVSYNWQEFIDKEIIGKIKGLKNITTEDGTVLELDDNFKNLFIEKYIIPRFDQSKSIVEFTQYIDVKQENENIFQTETTINDLQELASVRTSEFYSGLQTAGTTAGFDGLFYFDPGGVSGGEGSVEPSKFNRYQKQADIVNRDWDMARKNGNLKPKLPKGVENKYTWNELAYIYGVDINDKEQFARLHFQIKGSLPEFGFDPAKDAVTGSDVKDFIADTLVPALQEQKADFGGGPFKDFVAPAEFADSLTSGLNPLDQKEYEKAIKAFGLDADIGIDELNDFISESLQVDEAARIRAGIKELQELKLKPTQKRLGITYIERDEDDVPRVKEERDFLFKTFKDSGFEGTRDEFYSEFFPGESREDIDFVNNYLSGDLGLDNLDDPFQALGAIAPLLGDDEGIDLFGNSTSNDNSFNDENYFAIFDDPEGADQAFESFDNSPPNPFQGGTGGLFAF